MVGGYLLQECIRTSNEEGVKNMGPAGVHTSRRKRRTERDTRVVN